MQPEELDEIIPSAALAANMLSNLASTVFLAFGGHMMEFCKAQQAALLDPSSALTDPPEWFQPPSVCR
jgi:hypothetical protein